MNETRLFVGNLPFEIVDKDLQEYFSGAGAVTSVNVVTEKLTGRSRGVAFVEFASIEEAWKAVELFHEKQFCGRLLTVNLARPSPARAGGSRHGGS